MDIDAPREIVLQWAYMTSTSKERPSQRATLVARCGLAGALALGLLPISTWLIHGDSIGRLLAREAIWWCCALAILLLLTLIERLPLSSIRFFLPTLENVLFCVLAAVTLNALLGLQ